MSEEMKKLTIVVTVDEQGQVEVNTPKNLPVFVGVGLLEIAKNMLIEPQYSPTDVTADESEVVQ